MGNGGHSNPFLATKIQEHRKDSLAPTSSSRWQALTQLDLHPHRTQIQLRHRLNTPQREAISEWQESETRNCLKAACQRFSAGRCEDLLPHPDAQSEYWRMSAER